MSAHAATGAPQLLWRGRAWFREDGRAVAVSAIGAVQNWLACRQADHSVSCLGP